ncbi:hypothetical protein IW261DRAFT_1560936 [Armillaria novae-zelandiae]|uniref:Uncharacterized protein n=1 Tax=Armillaria novae-zelandiae TaxID=153914 RepID=A0AA39PF84_9AGAR|nr:hypothetical protein IW261DRAFT_1560936 [Armillaria novae-zelandiae]
MSSVVLPSRGQCIQTTDGIQRCQCLWFFPPGSSLLDSNTCSLCKHGIHAHADYVSMVVNHYPMNQCAAYAQMTHMMQFCTCGAQFCEHIGAYNSYHIPEPWIALHYFNPGNNGPSSPLSVTPNGYPNDISSPFSPNTTLSSNYGTPVFSGDMSQSAVPLAFTPTYMPVPSNSSYPYGDTVIFAPTPQPVAQMVIPQIGAQEGEHSYGVQFQDDSFSVDVQDSSVIIHQDYSFDEVYEAEARGQLE